jgi:glucose-6-phosphate 1-dehydrogenase
MHERWDGVPFIFNAGKALDEQKVEVVIKFFKETPGACQMFGCDMVPRNELVMELEPENNVRVRVSSQVSMRLLPMQSTLDLSYKHKFPGAYTPDPYVRLMLEVLGGKQATFVRSDELLESWRIFTPVPDKIDQATKNGGNVDGIKVPVHKYKFGTTEDFMRY